jgi:hypothetical protein
MTKQAKQAGKAGKQTGPKKDRAWFQRKVAELKAELGKLPADRQEQLRRELDNGNELSKPLLRAPLQPQQIVTGQP